MGKFLAKAYIQNPDSIQDNVTAIHMVSDSATPTDVSNSLGSVAVDDADFTWDDTGTNQQKLQLATQNITATGDGVRRHLVGWDGAAVVFATPVTNEYVQTDHVYATPADLDVADVTFNA